MASQACSKMKPLTPTQLYEFTRHKRPVAEQNFRALVNYYRKLDERDRMFYLILEKGIIPDA